MRSNPVSLAALLLTALALAAAPVGAAVAPPPAMATDAGNAVLPDARASLGISTYTPTDFGAKCDSNGTTGTDDATAINAMFTAIRTANLPFRITTPENKTCFIASTINATGLNGFGNNLGRGATIELRLDCATNGTPCVDALSSRWINWEYLYIHGEASTAPSYGIQIGRISAASADLHYFNRPVISGNFTIAPFYNFASETVTVVDPFFSNTNTTGTSYGLIQDGYNHFNITSAFVTQTLATDTPQSFNENTFIGGWFSAAGATGYPIWLGNTARHKWVGSYAASFAPNCVQLYQTGGQANTYLDMDLHCETTVVTDVFLLTGPQTAPLLPGFRYRDNSPQPSNSVFKVDTGIVSVTAADFDVRIGSFANGGGNSVKLFNDASLWTVGGHIALPNVANWTQPTTLSGGDVCLGPTCYPVVPTAALNRNPDFVIDQKFEGAANLVTSIGQLVIDGWREREAGAICSNQVTYQQVLTSPSPDNVYALKESITTPGATTAAQRCIIRSAVEGIEVAALQWGTAAARDVVLDIGLLANNTGIYNFALADSGQTHSYVVEANVTAANTIQNFSFRIPGPTTSGQFTRNNAESVIGVYLIQSISSGSNYQTPANTWTAGDFTGTSGALNFLNTSSATLQIEYVRLRPGPISMPYLPRSASKEWLLAQRWYAKTFAHTVAVGQNKGTVGALATLSPYAFATFASVGMKWNFPARMFLNNHNIASLPTMIGYSPSAATANCYNLTKARDSGAASFSLTSDASASVTCALISGDVIGDTILVHATADTGF